MTRYTENGIKVSVIVPVYNSERYLEKMIDSVIDQTLRDIEIIFINDGSTDNSLSILERYSEKDPRIKILSNSINKNAGYARNLGIDIAEGEYLLFLDSDDFFERDMLEHSYNMAKEKETEIIMFCNDYYDEVDKKYKTSNNSVKREKVPNNSIFSAQDIDDFYNTYISFPWNKLIKADFIRSNELKFQEQRWVNDRYFITCAMTYATRIVFIDEIFVHKRINQMGGLTTNFSKEGDWKCPMEAAVAIDIELSKKGVYKQRRKDLINYHFYYILWLFDKFLNDAIYSTIYETVKKKYLEMLNMNNLARNDFYRESNYVMWRKIKELNAVQFKWYRKLKRSKITYIFPFENVKMGTNIILYGAGNVGKDYYVQLMTTGYASIVAWADQSYYEIDTDIISPQHIIDFKFDMVVIAVCDGRQSMEIRNLLNDFGINNEMIVWRDPEIAMN